MTGPKPLRPRSFGSARHAAAALAALALCGLATSAGRAEQPVATSASVAAAFADLGPAQTAPFARPAAVDVTEVLATDQVTVSPDQAAQAGPATPLGGGMASFYGRELAGNRTANGEAFDPGDLTAAHRTLPFGTRLRVTNQRNGMSVVVRVNDRGPYARGRVLDLSQAAAERIDMVRTGSAPVTIELLQG